MALVLTEEQEMLRQAASGFLAESAPVAQLRRLRDDEDPDGYDRATWGQMAEMGWAGVLVPETAGGVGLGFVEAGVIAEEMGRTLTASPFHSAAVMGAVALNEFGAAAHADLLGRIATGQAADTDTVVASAKAYVNALNRLLVRREKSDPDADVKTVSYRDVS